MRILIISRDFPGMLGGVSDHTFHLSMALAGAGQEVYVLTSKSEKIPPERLEGVKVMPLVERWGWGCLNGIFHVSETIKPDWIILQYVPHMYSRYAVPFYIPVLLMFLKIKRFKSLVTFHEIALRLYISKPKQFLVGISQRFIAYSMCLFSDRLVVSIDLWARMLRLFSGKIYRIPIGSNVIPAELSESQKQEIRKRIAGNEALILATFGMDPKRSDLLVEVIRRLKEEHFPIKMLFVGAFSKIWVEAMKKSAEEKGISAELYFTGFISPEEIFSYLAISDIFVLLAPVDSKRQGGVGIKSGVVAAAYAAGLPILANRGDMTDDDFFKDRENIFLINSLDPEVVANTVKTMVRDEGLMRKLRENARITYEEKLSWPVIARQYLEILNGI